MAAMLGRSLAMAVALTAVSVGVASLAGRAGDGAPAPTARDESNWTTRERGRGTAPAAPQRASAAGEVRLERAGDSHFYADVAIDGTPVRMMVDSGASVVALTRRDAEAIGIDVDRLPMGGTARTAGGDVPLRRVVLASVDIDGIEVRGVEAAVLDADMGVSLLGQSYLAKLAAVNVAGDTMTLR
jgi:aspartyl protease family protein